MRNTSLASKWAENIDSYVVFPNPTPRVLPRRVSFDSDPAEREFLHVPNCRLLICHGGAPTDNYSPERAPSCVATSWCVDTT